MIDTRTNQKNKIKDKINSYFSKKKNYPKIDQLFSRFLYYLFFLLHSHIVSQLPKFPRV